MPTAKLTKRAVDAVQPGERDVYLWDTRLKGFGLKVTRKGARTYILQYRMGGREARTRRVTIGAHGSPWTPDTARAEANRLLSLVKQGQDPMDLAKVKRQAAVELAFSSYADLFVARHASRNRSVEETRRILQRDAKPFFGDKPLPEITRRDVRALIDEIEGRAPAMARLVFATLRKLFAWAVDRGDLERSPVEGMKGPAVPAARDRFLSDPELQAVWAACDRLGYPFGPLVRLLIATGQRRQEVAGMRWEELDLDAAMWTIPGARAKNGQRHMVPLNRPAMAVLRALEARKVHSSLVFTTTGQGPVSGFSRVASRLTALARENAKNNEHLFVEPWRLHDLRRTVATGLQKLGVKLEVTESLLNHISGTRSGIVGTYQRHDWAAEKRRAMDAWGEYLSQEYAGDDRKVVHLRPQN